MIRPVLLAALVVAVLPAAEGTRVPNDRATDDLRLLVGVAPPIRQATIHGVQSGGETFDQSLSSRPMIGPRLGLRYLHGTWLSTDGGLKWGVDAVMTRSPGTVRDENRAGSGERDLLMTGVGLALVGGPTVRLDVDALDSPYDFVEVEVLGSIGPALVRASNDRVVSEWTTGLRGSLGLGLVVTRFDRWQVGVELGGEWIHSSTIRWSNTGDAAINAWGLTGGLQLGRRW